MDEKKRKGYATMEQQVEANKRYYENNEDAKAKRNRRGYKSSCKKFILEFATEEELTDIEGYINQRKKMLEK